MCCISTAPTAFTFLPTDLRFCDDERQETDRRGGLDSSLDGPPPKQTLTKEGAVAALDPSPASPWNLSMLSSPEATAGKLLTAISSRPAVVGCEGEEGTRRQGELLLCGESKRKNQDCHGADVAAIFALGLPSSHHNHPAGSLLSSFLIIFRIVTRLRKGADIQQSAR